MKKYIRFCIFALLLILFVVPLTANNSSVFAHPLPAVAVNTRVLCDTRTWHVEQIGDAVRIFYKRGSDYLQYGAIDLASSYLRLNSGAGSGWGTSIVLLPSFWSNQVYYQGSRVRIIGMMCLPKGQNLGILMAGTIATLRVYVQMVLYPPTLSSITARIVGSAQPTTPLTIDNRPGEAFKPVMLSSMRISTTQWDTSSAFAGSQSFPIPANSWIISPQSSTVAVTFGLRGGTSSWKTRAPTIRINLSQPMQIAGWVTPSNDPNDDNVGLWAASDTLLSSWRYQIVASRTS